MTESDRPWEPPAAGTEVEHLLGMLERLRATFRWKSDGLDAAGLGQRLGASSLTLGGLLKHLALIESTVLVEKAFGEDPGEPWSSVDWDADPDWEFRSAASIDPDELRERYRSACERSRAAVRSIGDLDRLSVVASRRTGEHFDLRWIMLHMIEETARHAGHAALLREAVDGTVGE